MKANSPKPKLLLIIVFSMSVIFNAMFGVAQASNIGIWAMDETESYPVVLASTDWVLIGTTLGENFEEGYSGKEFLENLLLDSILQISSSDKPKVAVFSGGDSGDIGGMQTVMNKFVTLGYIDSFDLHSKPFCSSECFSGNSKSI